MDGSGMGGSTTKGFEVDLTGSSQVVLIDGEERDQLDGINLDLALTDAIAATDLHLWSAP